MYSFSLSGVFMCFVYTVFLLLLVFLFTYFNCLKAFGNDLKEHLEAKEGRPIPMRVNEVTQQVKFKGMYREAVKTWMANKGF